MGLTCSKRQEGRAPPNAVRAAAAAEVERAEAAAQVQFTTAEGY
jgi:hypothetical protein